jgi:hypothetical protein
MFRGLILRRGKTAVKSAPHASTICDRFRGDPSGVRSTFSNKWRFATRNTGRDRIFRGRRCSDLNRELGSYGPSSSPLVVACAVFFYRCASLGRSRLAQFSRDIFPDGRQASWKKVRGRSLRLNQAEVFFEQTLGSERSSLGFVVRSGASHPMGRSFATIKASGLQASSVP